MGRQKSINYDSITISRSNGYWYLVQNLERTLRETLPDDTSNRSIVGSLSLSHNLYSKVCVGNANNRLKYILKQWIASKARADWLVKLRISCAIYLRATREQMASRFASVTSEEII